MSNPFKSDIDFTQFNILLRTRLDYYLEVGLSLYLGSRSLRESLMDLTQKDYLKMRNNPIPSILDESNIYELTFSGLERIRGIHHADSLRKFFSDIKFQSAPS
jgi:hypothetical protein